MRLKRSLILEMAFFIVSVGVVFGVSFLCSLAEAAILSMNVKAVTIENPTPRQRRFMRLWDNMRRNLSKPVAAILILNTLSNTGGSVVASSAFLELFGQKYLWIFSASMTFVILFGSEILPKIIGVEYNKVLIRYLVYPLCFFTKLFYPIIWLTELCSKPFRRKDSEVDPVVTSADIMAYASLARARKNIDLEQESIIVNSVKLKHKKVKAVMIPRDHIYYIINGLSLEENEDRFGGVLDKTRYPVCSKDSIDTIMGTVNAKKFERKHGDQGADYTQMLQEAVYVNEDITLLHALKMMRWNKRHMLFVKNNEDHLTGLITLEDIMDELVDMALPD